MYHRFFGCRERPFKVVPDPAYLFLSRSHEEALAHLRYAVMSGEGFVELTGEVGTGKTLICRFFFQEMAEEVETAYIFNPKMSAYELLGAISREFGIPIPRGSLDERIEALNAFLIDLAARGRKAILLIDEAQNLSPSVLEQIRLLTNLETAKNKLLQIILVGQPELTEKLDAYSLRQLAQRITLSCRLRPFSFKETEAYINHRLSVASGKPLKLFTSPAIRVIHHYCNGVPRLVNIACDRALLAAYVEREHRVGRRCANAAIKELESRGERRGPRFLLPSVHFSAVAALAAACLIASVFWSPLLFSLPGRNAPEGVRQNTRGDLLSLKRSNAPHPAPLPSSSSQADSDTPKKEQIFVRTSADPSPLSSRTHPVGEVLSMPEAEIRRPAVARALAAMWEKTAEHPPDGASDFDDEAFFRVSARLAGLRCHRIDGDISLIHRLNIPAILKMVDPDKGGAFYLIGQRSGAKSLAISDANGTAVFTAGFEEIEKHWSKTAFVFWKDFYQYRGTIPFDAPAEAIITLKMHLRELGYDGLHLNAAYDEKARSAVRAVQERHGLTIDGYAGPMTQIVLYNEVATLPVPRLQATEKTELEPFRSNRIELRGDPE